jgi:hypothetical protein
MVEKYSLPAAKSASMRLKMLSEIGWSKDFSFNAFSKKPFVRIDHSRAKAERRKLNPTAPKPYLWNIIVGGKLEVWRTEKDTTVVYLFKKVIKKPNPTKIIPWISMNIG